MADSNSRLPRALLKGDATKYIAVEYELPNSKAEPHEVAVDLDDNGWVTQRIGGKLGRFDPKTLSYTEIAPPAGLPMSCSASCQSAPGPSLLICV